MNHSFSKKLVSIFTSREFILAALLVVASVIVSFFSPVFLSSANILSVIIAITVNGVIAVGMVMLLACGEMDLSVGKNMAFTGVIVAKLIVSGVPVAVAIVLSLLVAVFIGAFNGFFVSKIGLNAFITTLGMSCCIEGVCWLWPTAAPSPGCPKVSRCLARASSRGFNTRSLR